MSKMCQKHGAYQGITCPWCQASAAAHAKLLEETELEASSANDKQVGGTHYKGAVVQHWDFVKMHNIPYMEAQIIKYTMRWRAKNGLEDLKKAAHFLEKLIEQTEEETSEDS